MKRLALVAILAASCTNPPADVAITRTEPQPDARVNAFAAQPSTTTTSEPVRVRAASVTTPPETAPPPTEPPQPVSEGAWRTSTTSWYGPGFWGNTTACGQRYDDSIMGVAHKYLPCGTLVSFRHRGHQVTIPVIDRGPYVAGREWDLSSAACRALEHCFTGGIEWRMA